MRPPMRQPTRGLRVAVRLLALALAGLTLGLWPRPAQAAPPTIIITTTVIPAALPAPLYYIDAKTHQVTRLARDGVTARTLTAEAARIDAFDVSPADGSLVYVTANQLVQTDAAGGHRRVKVVGPAPAADGTLEFGQQIMAPAFSPHGGQIVFTLGGINLIAAGPSTRYTTLLPNRPHATPDGHRADGRSYYWARWSPTGERLLASYSPYEGQVFVIFDLATNTERKFTWEVDLSVGDGDAAWTPDGATIVVARYAWGYGVPGLSRVDASTGLIDALIVNDWENTSGVLAAAPFATDRDAVLYFGAVGAIDKWGRYPPYQISLYTAAYRMLSIVNPRPFRLYEALWDAQGRGVVVIEEGPGGPASWVTLATPCRLPGGAPYPGACGPRHSTVAPLPIMGSNLHWGVEPEPGTAGQE